MKMMAKKREPVVHKLGNIDADWEQATWVDRVREKKRDMGIQDTLDDDQLPEVEEGPE